MSSKLVVLLSFALFVWLAARLTATPPGGSNSAPHESDVPKA